MRKVAKKMREVAEKLIEEKVEVRKEDKSLKPFTIPVQKNLSNCGPKLVEITAISLPQFDDNTNPTLIPLSNPIVLGKRNHLLLKGPNGIGKTTFLESLTNGTALGCTLAHGLKIGYYRQDFSTLNYQMTVYDTLAEVAEGELGTEQNIRRTAASFLIDKETITQEIRSLSEGQKGLVSLAKLVLLQPGLLILDEPTNHINFRHLPAIANAFKSFEGALIIVSHDRHFLKNITVTEELDLSCPL